MKFDINNFSRKSKLIVVLTNDFLLALICWLVFGPPMATYIASEFSTGILDIFMRQWLAFVLPASAAIIYLYIFGFYRTIIKFFDSKDSILISLIGSMIFGGSWAVFHIYQFQIVSTSFLSIALLQGILLSAVFYAFLNVSRDVAKYLLYPQSINTDAKHIVIYGAGASGNELFQAILLDPTKKLLAFFDESKNLKDRQINNIPIFGSFSRLIKLKQQFPDLEVWLAMPSIQTEKRRAIITKLEKIQVAVRTVPSFHELITDQKTMADIQNLSLDDLLPRTRVERDVVNNSKDKNFLISGAGGSIGSEIVRQLLDSNPCSIILFDISEFNLFRVERECQAIILSKSLSTKIVPILGDIKDSKNLNFLFQQHKVDYVYHAAAYKHVPLVEDTNNIIKACENNVLGTLNLAKASMDNDVESFVMISTDKAVRPTNVMGASKRMAEILIQSLNTHASKTNFSMVRFGNVLNSSGSVIPLFIDQIAKGGPVTLTHKEVTRYFMTIPEASNLVLQASQMADGGEVFILDMGEQVKIYDLAKKLIHLSGRNVASEKGGEGIEIIDVGLRPGEKMYEELLISGEEIATTNPKIYKSIEQFPDLETIHQIVQQIQLAIDNNDHQAMITIFQTYVEGYNR
ncbi:polysaccharide biosynthesis protein [Gammaproteobacteria bacterium]|nr:polysaccharide biosynthesis protein [Gammaproteobacteria bacterium]MDA9174471.1 polysaccharide biosynthesis protein [Gammaproteobacteria bacterium]MDA9834637.1 polysaccharide biosynthesis protein [Gammaproteobacteria bacterium]MDA9979670.1 polysaccharide biosynthesis protein [Gammaproteobacteria bacterium]MDC3371947.1 polysaccharide biosynthesis protein [Gammaproteobacteria bacterium]